MSQDESRVCVVIAAMNAGSTIARAVRSALNEAEVAEVVVVDDGSGDDTAAVARSADDGTGRLTVLSLAQNVGPSAARNRAIAASHSPLIAILDADDFFLPGRFAPMLSLEDWDFIADNILFIDAAGAETDALTVSRFEPAPRQLALSDFIRGNISRRGRPRGEIGFLKPVMRRAFLDRHALRYREEMRLGEDYDLYARALIRDARYTVVHTCGYAAVVRSDSLSVRHKTADLEWLGKADRMMLEDPALQGEGRALIARHEAHVRGRFELRRFLDEKRERGLAGAGLAALRRPTALPAIVGGVAADKFEAFQRRGRKRGASGQGDKQSSLPRYLMPGRPVS